MMLNLLSLGIYGFSFLSPIRIISARARELANPIIEDFLYLHLHTAAFGEFYMLFMQISTHSPESCPMHNEKVKKASVDLMAKMDQLTRKHGIKVVGGWHSHGDHFFVVVYDAPNMEAVLKFEMEPEVMVWTSYHNTQVKPVMTLEESMKMLK